MKNNDFEGITINTLFESENFSESFEGIVVNTLYNSYIVGENEKIISSRIKSTYQDEDIVRCKKPAEEKRPKVKSTKELYSVFKY